MKGDTQEKSNEEIAELLEPRSTDLSMTIARFIVDESNDQPRTVLLTAEKVAALSIVICCGSLNGESMGEVFGKALNVFTTNLRDRLDNFEPSELADKIKELKMDKSRVSPTEISNLIFGSETPVTH